MGNHPIEDYLSGHAVLEFVLYVAAERGPHRASENNAIKFFGLERCKLRNMVKGKRGSEETMLD